MKLNPNPQVAQADPRTLQKLFADAHAQVNSHSAGEIDAVPNAATAAPTTGTHKQGDFVRNSEPSGSSPTFGWLCTASGEPGTWVAIPGSGGAAADTAVYTTTWDPLDKHGDIALSGGNLTATKSVAGDGHRVVRATHSRFGGKWYWEVVVTTDDGNKNNMVALASPQDALNLHVGNSVLSGGGIAYYGADGNLYRGGVVYGSTYATFAAGDVIGVAYDADNQWIDWSKNNVWLGRNPGTGKIAMAGGIPKGFFPAVSIYKGGSVASLTGRFARASFTGTIPTGYAPFDND